MIWRIVGEALGREPSLECERFISMNSLLHFRKMLKGAYKQSDGPRIIWGPRLCEAPSSLEIDLIFAAGDPQSVDAAVGHVTVLAIGSLLSASVNTQFTVSHIQRNLRVL